MRKLDVSLTLSCTFQAALKAIEQAKEQGLDELTINTDSKFLIQSE